VLGIGLLLILSNLLSGCTLSGIGGSATYYTVQPGDTVYSIAWSAGVDYHKLAEWNGISSSYTIRPGQRLRIRPPAVRDSRRSLRSSGSGGKETSERRYHLVRKGDTLYRIALTNHVSVKQLIAWNGLGSRARIYPGQKLWLAPGDSSARQTSRTRARNNKGRRVPVTHASSNSATPARRAIRWAWPVQGKIITSYDKRSGRKGIDIAGSAGTPIRAAAAGTIVYQGSGLRGYGRLIIVKHNNDFLSAYAHCDSFLLKEGSKVKRGTEIARMGATGTNRNQLHFEIRYQGNPVNPMGYLPGT
jgi:lipoprotein NlpD